MKKIKEVIVVEGKDDTKRIQRAVDADTIETRGSAIPDETLDLIKKVAETRGIIVFTNPDFSGEKIRKTISAEVPNAKHAFITKKQGVPNRSDGSLGVEHASIESIREALSKVYTEDDSAAELISREELMHEGLMGNPSAKKRRNNLASCYESATSMASSCNTGCECLALPVTSFWLLLSRLIRRIQMTEYPQIASPTRTQAILNQYHLSAKKSLGQNFLTDLDVLDNIVEAAQITKDDNVIEIGPGIGGLTEQLAKAANKVLGFEIDANLLPVLSETLAPYDNIKIINQDILKANLPEIISQEFDANKSLKVVANLPYYITTPIVMNLIAGQVTFDAIVVMMQKEVAERLTAVPSTKPYGSLSVIVQELNDVEISFIVPKTAFIPNPKLIQRL